MADRYDPEDDGDIEENHDARARQAMGDEDEARSMFADPGGNSALRAATRSSPRNLPCPTCDEPNRLTRKDRALGYQCDLCADAVEMGF